MIRKIFAGRLALLAVSGMALLAFAACGTANTVRQAIGFEGEYVDACAPASDFELKALCSVKVYRGSVEIFVATAEANPGEFTDAVIVKAAKAEAVATPLADTALQALESYIEVLGEFNDYQATGQTVPPDILLRLNTLKGIAEARYAEAAPKIKEALAAISGE